MATNYEDQILNEQNQAEENGENASAIKSCMDKMDENLQQIEKIYTVIGKNYFEAHKEDANAESKEQIQQIVAFLEENKKQEDRIRELKNLIQCPSCGAEIPKDARFCIHCGTAIVKDDPLKNCCRVCGAPLVEGARFCMQCGAEVSVAGESEKAESTETAAEQIASTEEGNSAASFHAQAQAGTESSAQVQPQESETDSADAAANQNQGQTAGNENDANANQETVILDQIHIPSDQNQEQSDQWERKDKRLRRCPRCGNKVKSGDLFCTECGFRLP